MYLMDGDWLPSIETNNWTNARNDCLANWNLYNQRSYIFDNVQESVVFRYPNGSTTIYEENYECDIFGSTD